MNSFTKTLRENFYNVDVVYPHEYEEEDINGKIFNVKKEYHFYDIFVIGIFLILGGLIAYALVDQMEEKGYMLLIFFLIMFCGLLG